MRKIIFLTSIAIGATFALHAQHNEDFHFITINEEAKKIDVYDPCNLTYDENTTDKTFYLFNKPVTAPWFQPITYGKDLLFKIESAPLWCPAPIGNIEFRINNTPKLTIRGDDGNIFMNGGVFANSEIFSVNSGSFFVNSVDFSVYSNNFSVNNEGVSVYNGSVFINRGVHSINFGDAYDSLLGYGISYIGFNAARNGNTKTWSFAGDGAHNGGGVIWSTVNGHILFAAVPSSSGSATTLTDAQIAQHVKLKLLPNGTLVAKEVLVTESNSYWPDFVFEKDYSLMNLSETEAFIKENKHLPEIPSAKEIEENGLNLGEMQAKLLQKIEELTLHAIEQQKLIEELQERLSGLEDKKGGE